MNDRTACLMERSIERYDSAEEAWEAFNGLREEMD